MPEVVSIGIAVLDVLARPVDRKVFTREATRVESVNMMPGGDALNVAVVLSKLGMASGLITKTGQDIASDVILGFLSDEKVDTSAVVRASGRSTSTCMVLVQENGERNFITMKGAHHYLNSRDIDWNYLKTAKLVNISSLFALDSFTVDEAVAVLSFCRDQNVLTSMDFMYDKTGQRIKDIPKIFPLLDYAFPSVAEARQLTGESDVRSMAVKLFDMGCAHVVIKQGEKGCFIKTNELEKQLPAMQMDVVDTTGAGDAFVAAYIYGVLHGWSEEKCGTFACKVGALNCREIGATAGIPADIEPFTD